jgi:hypothetical protein
MLYSILLIAGVGLSQLAMIQDHNEAITALTMIFLDAFTLCGTVGE